MSCGIELQAEDPQLPGFIKKSILEGEEPRAVKIRRKGDEIFDLVFEDLSEEERKLLFNKDNEDPSIETNPEDSIKLETPENTENLENGEDLEMGEKVKEDSHLSYAVAKTSKTRLGLKCHRCHQSLHQNVGFGLDPASKMTFDNVLRMAGHGSLHIYYVVSGNDFPLTINPEFFRNVDPERVHVVVNKGDLVADHQSILDAHYFYDFLNSELQQLGIRQRIKNVERVHVVSAEKGWGLRSLYESVSSKRSIYFFGEANVGKLSLVSALLEYEFYLDKRNHMSYNHFLKKKGLDKDLKKVLKPGAYILPGTTQGTLSFKLKGGCLIRDLPGYLVLKKETDEINYGVFEMLKELWIKHLYKVESQRQQKNVRRSALNANRKYTEYVSITDTDCYSFGGLFHIVGPENSITQIRTNRKEKGRRFVSLEKAIQVLIDQPDAIEKEIGVTKEFARKANEKGLVRYVIPPFFGSIDLVVKGIGYVTITPTKKLVNTDHTDLGAFLQECVEKNLYQVYAPEGLEVCIREGIDSFLIRKTKYRRSSGDIVLRKKEVPEDTTVVLRLYRVPQIETSVNEWFSQYLASGTAGKLRSWHRKEKGMALVKEEQKKDYLRRALVNAFW